MRKTVRVRWKHASAERLAVEVESPEGRGTLEYRAVAGAGWPRPPQALDFAAVGLAQWAAGLGADLEIEGPVTREQLVNLDELLQIWANWRPDLYQRIEVIAGAETPASPRPSADGAVLGFSGGVDAAFALAAHHDGLPGRLTRPIERAVMVVGWDLRHGDDIAQRTARVSAEKSLAAYGVPLTVVATNWQQDFCRAWLMSFGAGLAALLHTFATDCGAAVFATDQSYRDESGSGPYGSSIAINHLAGHPGFPLISTGGTHSRLERIEYLRGHPALLERLRVCFAPAAAGGNCGRCEKCVRTMLACRTLGIDVAGLFDAPLEPASLAALRRANPMVLPHYAEILRRMGPDDPLREPTLHWLRAQRRRARRIRRRARRRLTSSA